MRRFGLLTVGCQTRKPCGAGAAIGMVENSPAGLLTVKWFLKFITSAWSVQIATLHVV